METIKAGRGEFELFTQDAPLVAGLRAAETKIQSWAATVASIGQRVTTAGAGLAAGIGADVMVNTLSKAVNWIQEAARKSRSAGDELARMSDKTDVSVEALGALEWYGKRTDQSLSSLAKKADEMGPAFNAWAAEMRAAGLVMTEQEAALAAGFETALDYLTRTVGRIGQQLSRAIFPTLIEWAERSQRVAAAVADLAAKNQDLIATAFRVAVSVASTGAAIAVAGRLIGFAAPILGAMATAATVATGAFSAMSAVLGPLAIPVAAIAAGAIALGAAFVNWQTVGQSVVTWMSQAFSSLQTDVSGAVDAMGKALSAGNLGAAARVAMALIQMEFTKAANATKDVWLGVKYAFLDTWDDAVSWFGKLWTNPLLAIQEAFYKIWAAVQSMGLAAAGAVAKGFLTALGEATRFTTKMLVQSGAISQDAGQMQDFASRTLEDYGKREVDKGVQVGQADIAGRKANNLAELDLSQFAPLEEARKKQRDARAKQREAEAAAAEAALQSAQREYENARSAANGLPAKPGLPKFPGADPSSEDKTRLTVAGTFSATAARGLGLSGNVMDRIASATEKTAANTERWTITNNRGYGP